MLLLPQAIKETIVWAAPRVDTKNLRWGLRSRELRPDAEFNDSMNPGFFNQSSYIRQVATKRSAILGSQSTSTSIYGHLRLRLKPTVFSIGLTILHGICGLASTIPNYLLGFHLNLLISFAAEMT